MRILFSTMGSMVEIFESAKNELAKDVQIDQVGFYLSDREFYEKFEKRTSLDWQYVLKEWSLIEESKDVKVDLDQLSEWENRYFEGEAIWSSLYNDRRIFLGIYGKYKQQYSPRFNYEEMLQIFQTTFSRIIKLFDEMEPDVVFGFTPTTLGEYLIYQVAKERNIATWILRPSKLKNKLTFTTYFDEDYPLVRKEFERLKNLNDPNMIKKEVVDYLNDFKGKEEWVSYEGLVVYSFSLSKWLKYALQAIKGAFLDIRHIGKPKDGHNAGSLMKRALMEGLSRDIRMIKFNRLIKKRLVDPNDIADGNYVFFPLHAEPEIAVTLFSRTYYNQIEVIRNIALQLPVGYKLIVKEHPRNIGRRSKGYYKRIIDIPNVDFAHHSVPTVQICKLTKMTIVMSGFVGFETLLNQRPVITLGKAAFNMLSKTQINHVENIKNLNSEIKWSFENFEYDEREISYYLSAMLEMSEGIDLYTVLLRKKGRKGGQEFSSELYQTNVKKLAGFMLRKINTKH